MQIRKVGYLNFGQKMTCNLTKINNLSDLDISDKLKLAASILGYKRLPVSIDQFISDPYYLGTVCKNLYPYWVTKLRDIYPTSIHTRYPILSLGGAIGTGKSTFVRVMAMYQMHRLLCLKNIHDTFGLIPGKFIKFSFFSYSVGLAQTDFIDVINNWIEISPYFKELSELGVLDQIELVADGTRVNKNIGSDVLFYNLSELNFVDQDKAWEKLDQAFKRFDSRFGRMTDYFGHVILDTSAKGDDSISDKFEADNPYGDKVLVVRTNQWKVREHLNYYGNLGWFEVYVGDSIHQPFIVSKDRPVTLDMDPDRVIKVPEELRADFQFDLITALQDKAGISTNSSDRFFPDTTNLHKCFTMPMYSSDVIRIDFYDKSDKLMLYVDPYLRRIPTDKIIYIHYDIGVTGDNTGLSIAYFENWQYYDSSDKGKLRMPIITVPLAIGLNRFEGQETPIYQLEEFLLDLNQRFEIGMFSADTYASRQLMQDMQLNGIKNRYLSVDRTDEPYVFFKSLANHCLLNLPNNKLLKAEISDLRRVGSKVDHVSTGSKDISDSCCGAVYSCYLDIDNASKLSNKYKVETHSELIKQRATTTADRFQEALHNLY